MFQYGIDHLTVKKALQIMKGQMVADISSEAAEKIKQNHKEVLAIANGSEAVYGINTGFGSLANVSIKKAETVELQRKLLLSHSVGVGEPIQKEIAKMMLILKVHALAQGYSGIAMYVLERILWHIEHDIIPVVPEQGSVGASGDLAPLSHLFLPLLGEGEVHYQGEIIESSVALLMENQPALELHPKAGLALINGTQFIAAHAVFLVDEFHNALSHADIIAAMMIEGLKASSSPFDERLHELRPFKGSVHVAARVRAFLKDSEILESHKNCEKVQDPYSLRCVPQVHGSSRNAWLHLKECLEVEMNAVTDNPVIFSRTESISGGNFHGQPLAMPLDYACLAASELGNISDRRSYLSLEGYNKETPRLLMKDAGLNSGFMILQYTSAALASENKTLCFPASADSIPTSLGQEDHVSMGSISARKALKVCRNLEKILAIELLCAAQALDFQRPLRTSEALEKVHKQIRKHVPHADEDRIFSKDIMKVSEMIQSKELLRGLGNEIKSFSQFDALFENY